MNDYQAAYDLRTAYSCPVPGCRSEVADARRPCARCRRDFGSMIQPSGSPVELVDFLAEQHTSQIALHKALRGQAAIEASAL